MVSLLAPPKRAMARERTHPVSSIYNTGKQHQVFLTRRTLRPMPHIGAMHLNWASVDIFTLQNQQGLCFCLGKAPSAHAELGSRTWLIYYQQHTITPAALPGKENLINQLLPKHLLYPPLTQLG